jgi:hypothetical protein
VISESVAATLTQINLNAVKLTCIKDGAKQKRILAAHHHERSRYDERI